MPVEFIETELPGVLLIEPDLFKDDRGFFMETYHQKKYSVAGINRPFIQDNYSHSRQGTLRGLHYQLKHAQDKLIYVIKGEIFDVAVDIRRGSPTFAQWIGVHLSEENKRQIFIPGGFAHGFYALSETADVTYKCSDLYAPDDEYGVHWADPDIDIKWPDKRPILSDKDRQYPSISKIQADLLPQY